MVDLEQIMKEERRIINRKYLDKLKEDPDRLRHYNDNCNLRYWKRQKEKLDKEEWRISLTRLNDRRPDFCKKVIDKFGF